MYLLNLYYDLEWEAGQMHRKEDKESQFYLMLLVPFSLEHRHLLSLDSGTPFPKRLPSFVFFEDTTGLPPVHVHSSGNLGFAKFGSPREEPN